MAIWQYTLYVVPRDGAQRYTTAFPPSEDRADFDFSPIWRLEKIYASFFNSIESILPLGTSWGKSTILYGRQDSNLVEVILDEDGVVEDASFRIDFTSEYSDILRALIEFCIQNGLAVLGENLCILPLNLERIRGIIEDSPQVVKYRSLLKK